MIEFIYCYEQSDRMKTVEFGKDSAEAVMDRHGLDIKEWIDSAEPGSWITCGSGHVFATWKDDGKEADADIDAMTTPCGRIALLFTLDGIKSAIFLDGESAVELVKRVITAGLLLAHKAEDGKSH